MAIAEQDLFTHQVEPLPGFSQRRSERAILRAKRMAERKRAEAGATFGWKSLAPEYGEREVWE